ncbi:MAG: PHP domain-containing protein [Lachnospiraceae bacterium]|nr:PHP domain-containing protein [Lachnospiraceae bacterium]
MYKYETHIHTREASKCASVTGSEQALQYKRAGYEGIIITDHFFGGNTCIDRTLPWKDRIELFCKGYENAKETGDKIGLQVFFGFEQTYNGTDFLIYGLDKQWLIAHPEIEHCTIANQYRMVTENGGMVIHAHPFRDRNYIPEIRLFPNLVDGVEVINYGNREQENIEAYKYAKDYNLPMTSGSDGHHHEVLGGGVRTDERLNTIDDYIDLIKFKKNYKLL